MKSRASCCNAGLIVRDLRRTALLWGGYLLLWFVAMPGNLLSSAQWMDALDMRKNVLALAADTCHLVSAFYGLAVAWFLFSYLYKARSANFFGALPLRRETQFLSHYISGILCSLVPNLVLYGATVLTGAGLGVDLVKETAIWFAAHSLTFLFYYSFAVLCAMLVGNLIAMPVLYVVLNFTAVVVEALLRVLIEALLYGVRMGHGMLFSWLSPLYYFPMEGNGPDCRRIYENDKLVDVVFEGWPALLILGAVGIGLAVVAFFLYKGRRMESAGDVIAVKRLRPVFLYVFTFGCAIVLGTLLANILVRDVDSSQFLAIAGCLLAGAVAGHYLGHMMLQRTLRVFNRKNALSGGICLLVLVAVLGAMRLDVAGVVRYVPEQEDVVSVRLDNSRHGVEDPQRIAEVIELHRQIIERKSETEALCRESDYKPMLDVVYELKDGREVSREYRLPVTDDNYDDPDSLICQYDAINNTPEMILAREMPITEVTRQTVENCFVHFSISADSSYNRLEPSSQEAVTLWQTAMLKDLQEGNMGEHYYAENYHPTEEVAVETADYYSDVSVEFQLKVEDGDFEYCYYHIPVEAVHTRMALIELGVPEDAFELEVK